MSNRSVTNDAVCGHFSGVDNSMGCLLHKDTCCGCADKRSPTIGFVKSSGMRNGVMETTYLFRWGFYCGRCKDYWTSRLSKAPPNWSLDFPRRLIALMNSAPPLAEGSTSRARSTSTDTPPVNPFRPIASLGIPSSSGAPPLAVAAPDAGSDIPATVAPPPTSSPDTDTPVTTASFPSRSRTSLSARTAARAAANVPATVAPPPDLIASSPARDTSVTARPSPVSLNWTIFETAQPAPPPVLSKKAKKNAAKRARAAALEQQRQRMLASHVTPELPLRPAAPINVSPFGNRASALPSHPVSDLQDAIYRHSAARYPWDDEVPLYRDWDPPQTRLSPLNDSVAEAESERFGLGYHSWNAPSRERISDWSRGHVEAASSRYSPEPGNHPALYFGSLGLGEDEEEEEVAYYDEEWETLPADFMRHEPATTVLRNIVPQAPPPLSEEMRQLAEDTSVMLELIGKTDPKENTGMDSDYKQIIDDAFENVSKIRTQYRVALALKPGSVNLTQDPAPIVDDTLKIDSACIICCDEISNTVLLPCNHLVLCMTCSDKMGIKGKYTPGPRTVNCPICRRLVLDRIKIFRG